MQNTGQLKNKGLSYIKLKPQKYHILRSRGYISTRYGKTLQHDYIILELVKQIIMLEV